MKEDIISKRLSQLKPSGIRKFFSITNERPNVISLGVGEPDFQTPMHIRQKGIESLEAGRTFYTANAGLEALRDEISAFAERKMGVKYDPTKEILVTVGGSEAIDIALRSIINPGDEIVYLEPCYVSYLPCIVMAGGVAKKIELKEENRFRLTKEELEEAITDKTKALVMSFPNNPTGAIMEKEDLLGVAEVAKKHDLLVISDEIYSGLTYGKEHVSIASLPEMRERTIVINGFSKNYAMTGWRIGYAMGPAPILTQMTKLHQYVIMCAPTMGQYAAIEALKNGDDDVSLMRESYDKRRKFLLSEFRDMGLPCFEPEGAFYIFPNISKFGMSSEDFCYDMLDKEELALVPGDAFGDCGEGFVRISYAYSIEKLEIACKKIRHYIENFGK